MANNPPTNGVAFEFQIGLEDHDNPGNFQANPTIAAGDFKVSKDGGALANLATLPSVEPAGSRIVTISLSATEMTADTVTVQCVDQTSPKEWSDRIIHISTVAA